MTEKKFNLNSHVANLGASRGPSLVPTSPITKEQGQEIKKENAM